MEWAWFVLLICINSCCHCQLEAGYSNSELTREAGHLRKFGSGRPIYPIEEFDGFPDPNTFFRDYVFPLRPIKMKGAAKLSPAFSLWRYDDYFLSLDMPEDNKISVETKKKESRNQDMLELHFKEFLKSYNSTENYMVNAVPDFIGKDVILPCSLQCQDLMNGNLVDNVMWFSSGGTKSVVHTDAVDNLNCLYRGDKEFIMIDPSKYKDKVDIDHPEGSYMGVDVDSVDYTKYPGLAEVEFIHVNLSAGDCLFIPYKWIHQVRSYGNNVAVNIWWDHFRNSRIDLDRCNTECDTDITIDTVKFAGFDNLLETVEAVKDTFVGHMDSLKQITFDRFYNTLAGQDMNMLSMMGVGEGFRMHVRQMFGLLDKDRDGIATMEEVELVTQEEWEKMRKKLKQLKSMLERIYEEAEMEQEEGEGEDEGLDIMEDHEMEPDIKDEL